MKIIKTTTRVSSVIFTVLVALLLQFFSVSANASYNQNSPLGINTNEAMDLNSDIPFVDLFKLSLPFEHARPWLTKGNIKYDKYGWPMNLNGGQAGTRFISNLPALTIPHGVYTVLYDGKGKLDYGADAKLVRRYPGKDLIRIKPGKNKRISASIIIKASDPKNYVRNIRILMPGGICSGNPFKRVNTERQCSRGIFLSFEKHYSSILFNPDYLNFMKDFKVIRFMNMSGITRNDLSKWEDRPQVLQSTWGGKEGVRGIPLEVMVELANQINADPWFNLPHKADNVFVQRYAQYVKKHLKPNLKAYIEYTNEAWNGIFTQAHYMKKQGMIEKLDKDKDIAGYKFFSKRSVEIFRIWEQVFGNTDRIVRVMGGMTTNANLSHMLLGYREAYRFTDALAIAPYFYIDQKKIKKYRSVNRIFRSLTSRKNKYSIPKILDYVSSQAKIADGYGVDLIAYEGGQHLVAYGTHTVRDGPNPALIKANKDPRMAKLYYQFLKGWKDAGGKLFVAFSAPRQYTWIGSWGIKEYITQSPNAAPKYRALLGFKKAEPCWWQACTTTGPIIRQQKPANNPGKTVMARLFKPVKPEPAAWKKPVVIAARQTPKQAPLHPMDPLPESAMPRETPEPLPLHFSKASIQPAQTATASPRVKPLKAVVTDMADYLMGNSQTRIANMVASHRVKNPGKLWNPISPNRLQNIIVGNINGRQDLEAGWQSHWDNQYLHIRVDIADDSFVRDSVKPWGDDSVEIFIDADASRNKSYDRNNDFHFIYRWQDNNVAIGATSPKRGAADILHKMTRTRDGYTLETSIPWRTLGVRPQIGRMIGIDIHINDDDNGNSRDGKLAWNSTRDEAWKNPKQFGAIELKL
jgi:hypothetical protein